MQANSQSPQLSPSHGAQPAAAPVKIEPIKQMPAELGKFLSTLPPARVSCHQNFPTGSSYGPAICFWPQKYKHAGVH